MRFFLFEIKKSLYNIKTAILQFYKKNYIELLNQSLIIVILFLLLLLFIFYKMLLFKYNLYFSLSLSFSTWSKICLIEAYYNFTIRIIFFTVYKNQSVKKDIRSYCWVKIIFRPFFIFIVCPKVVVSLELDIITSKMLH